MKITVEITEAQFFALAMVTAAPQEWVENLVTNRARLALNEARQTPQWIESQKACAKAGGDIGDDEEVILAGRDAGLLKTASDKTAEAEAEAAKTTEEEI